MMTKKTLFFILIILTILGVAGRVMYHIPNVTPITALALFISTYFGVRYSLPTIITVMLVSDSLIGFYSWPVMISVYGTFLMIGLMGILLQKHKKIVPVFCLTIGSSLLFFIVTNWAVWRFGTMYPLTWLGLVEAYTMALPFFKNSLIGDIVYTGLFFGVYEYISSLTAYTPRGYTMGNEK